MKSVPILLSLSLVLSFMIPVASPVVAASAPPAAAKTSSKAPEGLVWHDFDSQIFSQAKKENKLIILDLEAVWCHWCHVMAEETYSNADVIKLLNSKYLCVRVDQDARPDLSNKYEEYGWPATIIFDADGLELVKHAGYIDPSEMARILKATASNSSGSKTAKTCAESERGGVGNRAGAAEPGQGDWNGEFTGFLPAAREKLVEKHSQGWDKKIGLWGGSQNFLDFDSAEYAMTRGLAGDKQESERAKTALDGELNLLDPAFGGLYQYSTGGDWTHPHFEKVMAIQADGLKTYSQAYLIYKDEKYLKAARAIAAFLSDFLTSPEGAFYTSQDADLKQGEHSSEYFVLGREARLKEGLPRIDQHIYSRENGLAANAMTSLYAATGEHQYLDRAIKAVTWIENNRAIKGSPGGFRHDEEDKAGPYLADTLTMGRAYLSLYAVTAERQWLKKARACSDFIGRHFQVAAISGFVTAQPPGDENGSKASAHGHASVLAPQPLLDENVMVSRFANLLFQYTGGQAYHEQALRALRYLTLPEVASSRRVFVSGMLLADGENHTAPLHITVVGRKDDPEARQLFVQALTLPNIYKRVEWFDKKEGPLPNSDTELPELSKAAAFSCGEGRCSRPAYSGEELFKMVSRLALSSQP